MPTLPEHAGFVSLVPARSVLALAFVTKRTFEALLGGTLIGYALTSGAGFFDAFVASMLEVMQDATIGWIASRSSSALEERRRSGTPSRRA